uniref:Uncharacterized protein n=1 Tax=Nelumbo nucifera TaxID=4432 RepID=A0A822Y3H4_NELNU|nr:TPA_asm: hypothetical protein HUJ06_027609 [Nelumbo nucifera]
MKSGESIDNFSIGLFHEHYMPLKLHCAAQVFTSDPSISVSRMSLDFAIMVNVKQFHEASNRKLIIFLVVSHEHPPLL